MVLLEVLVALAILAGAGLALAGAVSAALQGEADAAGRERRLAEETRLLTALTLLPGAELDHRLGHDRIGALVTNIERPEPTLYRVAVGDTLAPEVDALVTVVYRPEPRRVP